VMEARPNYTVQFKSPASLGVGTYTDTVTVQGCYDKACTQQVQNSPQTVSVTYSVTESPPSLISLSPSAVNAGGGAFVLTLMGTGFSATSMVQWSGSARPHDVRNFDRIDRVHRRVRHRDRRECSGERGEQRLGRRPGDECGVFLHSNAAAAARVVCPHSERCDRGKWRIHPHGQRVELHAGIHRAMEWQHARHDIRIFGAIDRGHRCVRCHECFERPGDRRERRDGRGDGIERARFCDSAAPVAGAEFDIPQRDVVGRADFCTNRSGQGFLPSAVIQWNSAARPTTFVSQTQLQAQIPAADIAAVGTASITVLNSQGAGGTSAALTLTVKAPAPDAVAFQITPSHSGAVTFNSLSFPAASAWSVDVGGPPSYALIADGKVFVTVQVGTGSQLIALDQSTGATVWGPIVLSGNSNAAYDGGKILSSAVRLALRH